MTSLRPIRAGEEILNYYGPHPNSELLRRYGYVTEKHSRYDVVEIPWHTVESAVAAQLNVSREALDVAVGQSSRSVNDQNLLTLGSVLELETTNGKTPSSWSAR